MPQPHELLAVARLLRCSLVLIALLPFAHNAAGADVVYTLSLIETFTDNVDASPSDRAESDLVSQITPGVRISSRAGRITGQAGIALSSKSYLSDPSRNTTYVQGDLTGRAELSPKSFFLDAGGSIRRQDASVFGRTSVSDALDTGNRNEVRRFFLSPRVEFALGTDVTGAAQLRQDWIDDSSGAVGTRSQSAASLSLTNPAAFGPLGWTLTSSYRRTGGEGEFSATNDRSVRAVLLYQVTPKVGLRFNIGRESNDLRAGKSTANTIRGAGLDWALSNRTKFFATIEKRFFGTGYNYSFSHSRPRSSLRIGYTRDVTFAEAANLNSIDELAFRDIFDSLASSIPDPVERERVAREQAAALPNGGIPLTGPISRTFQVSRNLLLSGSLVGARNVLSVALNRSENQRLGSGAGLDPTDDFSRFETISTQTASISLSHRLSGQSSLSGALTSTRAEGEGAEGEETTRESVSVNYSTRIGRRTTGVLSYRHQRSSGANSFKENALVGSLGMRF